MAQELIRNRYLLLKEIGSSKSAAVFKAWDYNLEKMVAVKKIHQQLTVDDTIAETLRQGTIRSSKLQHKNIVAVYDFFKSADNICYIIKEYVKGKNLSELLVKCNEAKIPFQTEIALKIISEISQALCYAHELRDKTTGLQVETLHLNVSPGNILISTDAAIKLADFRIVRSVSSKSVEVQDANNEFSENYFYMSPEQIEGKNVDHRSDLFSLGIVFYEILTGNQPFEGGNKQEVIEKITKSEPDFSKIPTELQLLIRKMLDKNIQKRFQSARELLSSLATLTAGLRFGKRQEDILKFIVKLFPDFQTMEEAEKEINQKIISKVGISEEFEMGEVPTPVTSYKEVEYRGVEKKAPVVNKVVDKGVDKVVDKVAVGKVADKVAEKDVKEKKEEIKKKPVVVEVKEIHPKPKKSMRWLGVTSIIILVGIILFEVFLDIHKSITPLGAYIKHSLFTSDVYIDTIPTGAKIRLIDSHENDIIVSGKYNNIAPVEIPNLSNGDYALIISKEGFKETSYKIKISKKMANKKTNRVEFIVPFEIKLKIDSIPNGAEVYLNGQKTEYVTPAAITLEAKPYAIRLNKEGFMPVGNMDISASEHKGICNLDFLEGTQDLDKTMWKYDVLVQNNEKLYTLSSTLEKEVTIKTNPGNAKVFFADNNKLIGESPVKTILKTGTYRLRITKDGYKTVERSIEIKGKDDSQFTLDLKRVEIKLKIDSTPKGAVVYLNGQKTEYVTPATISLETKPYAIRLVKEGFVTAGNMNVSDSERKGICNLDFLASTQDLDETQWNLEKSVQNNEKIFALTATLGKEVTIESNPSGAKVFLADNNQLIGETPVKTTLKTGTHNIKVTKDGYESAEKNIEIRSKEDKKFTFNLKQIEVKIKLNIDSNPQGADVYINGEKTSYVTPAVISLEKKPYAIRLSKEGFTPVGSTKVEDTDTKGKFNIDFLDDSADYDENTWELTDISKDNEKAYTLSTNLTKVAAAAAPAPAVESVAKDVIVTIETTPPQAKVFLVEGNILLGETPLKTKLKTGKYRIQIMKLRRKPIVTTIEVKDKGNLFTFTLSRS
ncbi:MAG: serine/threonine protein kinase [Elusimicrobia bacterium]|nr:serine/threonine protein kinase [Elusimicrobiota bacterium]